MLALTRHEVKTRSAVFVLAIIFSTLILSFAIFDSFYLKLPNVQSILSSSQRIDLQTCEMSWSRPSYIEIQDKPDSPFSKKYTLYLYREGYLDSNELQGIPALFIPGQAGSYKQVRSLAAETATYYHDHYNNQQTSTRTLDYFTVDLNEELSALNGQTILEQAEYMNAVIQHILQLYKNSPQNPSSVLIVGHSMGGLVARSMFMSPSYVPGSINTIITLASPHLKAPLLLDPVIYKTYKRLTEFWTHDRFDKDPVLKDVSITSITGGFLDTIVDSNGASLESFVPETHGFSVVSSSIPFVWTGCDHMAILWCNQLVKVLAKSLVEITDISSPAQTLPLLNRIQVFKHYLTQGLGSNSGDRLFTANNHKRQLLPFGSSLDYDFDKPTSPALVLMKSVGSNAFITNVPVSLDMRWSVAVCKGPDIQKLDCKAALSDLSILPSAIADKPIMADPFRLITLKDLYLNEDEYIGIIDNGGPAIPSGFIVSDNATNLVEHNIDIWDIITGNAKFNTGGYYSQHIVKKIPSSLLAYSLHVTKMETKGVRFQPFVKLIASSGETQFYRKLEIGSSSRITLHKMKSDELELNFFTDSQELELTLQIDWYGTLGRIVLGYGGIIVPFLYSNALIMALSQLYTYLINGKSKYPSFNTTLVSCLKGPFLVILNLVVFTSGLQTALRYFDLGHHYKLAPTLLNDALVGSDDIALPIVAAFLYLFSIGILVIVWLAVSLVTYIIGIPIRRFTGLRVRSQQNSWRLLSIHLAIISGIVRFVPTSTIFMCYYIIWTLMTASVYTKSDLPTIRNTYEFSQSWLIFLTSLLPYYLPSFIVCLKNIILGWTSFNVSIDELVQDVPILYLMAFLVTALKSPEVFQLRWIKPIIILLNYEILYQILFGFTHPFLLSISLIFMSFLS